MVDLRPVPGAAGARWSPGWLWWWARHAVVFEVRLYRNLFRWVTRRPDRGGEPDEPFTYARMVTPVMWLWIFASACEIPLAHVLVPWESVRLGLLVVGVWGLVWMIGLLASLWVYPHLLTPDRLVVRNGASHRVGLPWERIASLTVRSEDMESSVWTLQPVAGEHGTDLNVATGALVNVHAVLTDPTVWPPPRGGSRSSSSASTPTSHEPSWAGRSGCWRSAPDAGSSRRRASSEHPLGGSERRLA